MAKIGITSSYLESMNAQLADRASGTPSVNDAPRSHLRSESVYAAPFVPRSMANADAAHTRGHRQLGPRHQTAMSMNVPSFCEGFMRQQPPYGPRELRSSRADGAKLLRLESAGLVGAVEEEAENEMEGGNAGSSGHLQQPHSNIVDDISKPLFAESRMLQQSSANIVTEPEFGLTSSAASEEPERRASSPKASPAVHIHNRIAIEGAVGHSSMPNSASAHMEAEGGNDGLNTFHEPRKSISAPDLHERLLEAAQGAGLAESPADTEHSERESSDIASDVDTEYSNPSDEAQARARRDKGLSSASFSPAAGLHSLDSWLEPSTIFHPNQSIPTHFSGEHDTSKSSRQTNSNKATPTLNAAAPPFVLNAQLTMRDATSSSMTSNTVTNGLPNPFVPKPPKPLPTKSSFGASESRFSFAQKPILNVAAVENEPRHATNTTSNSTPWGIDSSSQPGEQDPEVSEDAGTKTLMEAKLATCSLLPDKVPAQTELHSTSPVLDTLDSDSSETIHSMAHDKVRRFKFPAPLSSKPVNRNGASSSKAPTLAAFGTIGRNTFQDGLESFICETDCSNDPVISAAHQAPIRHRASIPAFVDSVVREHSIHVIPQEGADRMHRSSNESSRASLSVPLVKCGDSKPGRHSEEEQQPPPTPVSIEVTVCASRPTPPSRLCQDVVRHKLQHAPPALLEDALDEARRETQLLKAVQETQNILSRIAHMQAISYDVENSSPSVQSPSNLTPSQLSGNRDATTSPSLASAEAVVNPGPEPTEAGFVISDQYLHTVSQAVKTGLMDAVPELLQALLPSCIPIPADHPATALESIAKPCLSDPENEKIVQRSGASVDDVSMLDNSHSFLTKDLVSELTLGCKALRDKREKLEQLQYLRQGQYVEDLENSQAAVGESRDDRGIFEEELLTAIREMGAERSLAENLRKELEESNLHVCELERQLGAESLIHKERQTAYKTELATLARKEEEHVSTMSHLP